MRIVTPEYLEKLKNGNSAYATIINTPRPDFTELHRMSMEFEQRILKEQEKFVQSHVKPKYDAGCRFMYQTL